MIVPIEGVRKFVLDNGLHVYVKPTTAKTTYVKLRVYHAAVNENPDEEGYAHLLEHCFAKGTSRSYEEREARKIRKIFTGYNATTYQDTTAMYADLLPKNMEEFLRFSSDMFFFPAIDIQTLEREKLAVLRELSDSESAPAYNDNLIFDKILYDDHPAGADTVGNRYVVENATRENLLAFHERGYSPCNSNLIIVGDLPGNIEDLVQNHFNSIENRNNPKRFIYPTLSTLKRKTVIHSRAEDLFNRQNPNESSCYLKMTFVVPPRSHEDYHGLVVLSNILGAFEGRLINEIREQRGLAYTINSSVGAGQYGGIFTIRGKVRADRKDEAIEAIFGEFDKLRSSLATLDELDAAKLEAEYAVARTFETNNSTIRMIESIVDGHVSESAEEFMKKTEKLKAEDVQKVAERYLPSFDGNYVMIIRDPLKSV